MDVLVPPVALMTGDDGPRLVPVDIAEDGAVVVRGTDVPIDVVDLVEVVDTVGGVARVIGDVMAVA